MTNLLCLYPSGVFQLRPDYPFSVVEAYETVVHSFGSNNAKTEQRFLLGTGARVRTFRYCPTFRTLPDYHGAPGTVGSKFSYRSATSTRGVYSS